MIMETALTGLAGFCLLFWAFDLPAIKIDPSVSIGNLLAIAVSVLVFGVPSLVFLIRLDPRIKGVEKRQNEQEQWRKEHHKWSDDQLKMMGEHFAQTGKQILGLCQVTSQLAEAGRNAADRIGRIEKNCDAWCQGMPDRRKR